MRTARLPAFVAIAFSLGLAGHAALAAPPAPAATPLVAEVLSVPRLVHGSDDRFHLVYELRLSNVTDQPAVLKRIAVIDQASGRRLLNLEGEAIAGRVSLGGHGEGTTTLGGFQFGLAFLHVGMAAGEAVPTGLVHEIEGSFARLGTDVAMRIAGTPVVATMPPLLGPPLRGGGYVAGDGCCDSTRHVRALLPMDGAFRLAQRFAIDWERVDEGNRIVSGDLRDLRSYRIYGEPVLAVADGRVVHARDGLPDQTPGALPPGLPIEEADGNSVVLDIGGGAYVLYAHLRPGSVKVSAGEQVRRGDPIGEVGNSGNSQAPHLHLHVMDGPSSLAADGLPYLFDAFTVTALDEAGTADFDRAEATGRPMALTPLSPPLPMRARLPLDLSVIRWGDPEGR